MRITSMVLQSRRGDGELPLVLEVSEMRQGNCLAFCKAWSVSRPRGRGSEYVFIFFTLASSVLEYAVHYCGVALSETFCRIGSEEN